MNICIYNKGNLHSLYNSLLSGHGSLGMPIYLESYSHQVTPAAGVIKPGQIMEVSVQHEEFHTLKEFIDGVPQNCWCEDTRDKEVLLAVKTGGCFSTDTRTHRVRVRHYVLETTCSDSKASSGRIRPILLHRSDFQHLGSSSDVINDLSKLHLVHEESL